ncbi:hypothetical protein H9Q69_011100 [Fusarium xylarioides]|uniref:Uncharacterized protein n=1 Tax=Fusarium xylarioides TaxID=221167 RepID=A0A9P7IND7_9HYPO|nr:hypothetical protein H9Q70_007651 [Fusarium xylarioides]KAG5764626.1 hypothetical protein H9Q72_007281 [Fusarium xylarioides]KAG5784211.1 hypothetical protein H9Q73_002113 [Fusarium xylarioides]KAG5789855.1 hypothetical protein H9Q69_011100 [Fusarium xylarioides]KAG5807068.1 hypothetical protein H9Q71_008367 [Fusarium xylarioides]
MANSTVSEFVNLLLVLFSIMFCCVCLKDFVMKTASDVYNYVVQFLARCQRALYWSLWLMLFMFILASIKVLTEDMNNIPQSKRAHPGGYYGY